MYKCIYDITTNRVIAVCMPDQNFESLMANWTNVDYIEVDSISNNTRNFNYLVDPQTRELISA